MPAAAPRATDTAPVAAFNDTAASVDDTCARLTRPSVAAAPANVSLASTFATAIPPLRDETPVSLAASIAYGTTGTVAVPSAQLAGLATSQMRYMTEWSPAAAAADTDTAPLAGLKPTSSSLLETSDSATSSGPTGAPSSVSFVLTSPIAVEPGNAVARSLTAATTNGARTVRVADAPSQLFALPVSQIS